MSTSSLMRRVRQQPLLICTLIVIAFLLFARGHERMRVWPRTLSELKDVDAESSKYTVKTANGTFTYAELEKDVFRPFGYKIIRSRPVIPQLAYIEEPTCEKVFIEYADTSQKNAYSVPPAKMPDADFAAFSLNGFSKITFSYMNNKANTDGTVLVWNNVQSMVSLSDSALEQRGYNGQSASLNAALAHFGVKDQTGIVVGSLSPWAEAMALKKGAKKVVTVEYSKIEIEPAMKDRMEAILAPDLPTTWQTYAGKFDFALSFSSIEHSGLGRFGDPLDPIGDFREMAKIRCLLKPGALLYFAVPNGMDGIVFNLHRIYGPVRLAIMFAGFEWVTTFVMEKKEPVELTPADFDLPHPKEIQRTIVLRKI